MVVILIATMASATMIAADWNAFDLKGRVKSVTYYNSSSPYMWPYNEEVCKYSFNAAGNVIAPKYDARAKELGQKGGYTRIIKTGIRKGDNAEMAIIELI